MSEYYFYKGRVALYALLKSFGIGSGDRVLLPGYTCIVVPSAIRYLGALPEYADIDPVSFNSRLADYEETYRRLVKEKKETTLKAVIIQHTYGNPNSDTEALVAWAKEKELLVLEDAAHVNGVSIGENPVGSFGDGAFFSTQWSKPFTTGLGGIARLNNEKFAIKLAKLEGEAPLPSSKEDFILRLQLTAHSLLLNPRIYWLAIKTHRALAKAGIFVGSSEVCELAGEMPNNYLQKMGPLQKNLLQKRSRQMPEVNAYRLKLVAWYDQLLEAKGMAVFPREAGAILIRYPLRVKDKPKCLAVAESSRIELGEWFEHPLHPAGCALTGLNWQEDYCPTAVTAAKEVINLPVHPRITFKEAQRIVDFVAAFI